MRKMRVVKFFCMECAVILKFKGGNFVFVDIILKVRFEVRVFVCSVFVCFVASEFVWILV